MAEGPLLTKGAEGKVSPTPERKAGKPPEGAPPAHPPARGKGASRENNSRAAGKPRSPPAPLFPASSEAPLRRSLSPDKAAPPAETPPPFTHLHLPPTLRAHRSPTATPAPALTVGIKHRLSSSSLPLTLSHRRARDPPAPVTATPAHRLGAQPPCPRHKSAKQRHVTPPWPRPLLAEKRRHVPLSGEGEDGSLALGLPFFRYPTLLGMMGNVVGRGSGGCAPYPPYAES